MNQKLQEIIKNSTFQVQEGIYVYAKVAKKPECDKHFMVSQDKDEITVVTKEGNLEDLDLIERNKEDYKLIALNLSVPFYAVGFLAAVSSAIAKAGMNILIVSTFSKDYILVREGHTEKAIKILNDLGFNES
ncbi:MAG: hypothetical protein ACD_57C00172G0002 [uncultured bacterium]|uniref:CASTOR ACT domain-containing protein n=1 Tax=Candidatus Curtissbacteria bacterium RIFOXYA1_FULL_41_14 TaxID=1797737 RepID=A0A1F5HFI4_9BACT|nr:MAG: hypothetical protein ACD_57C00172G0002 [uncultured bacterium]KKR61320.1 MAG: hypothetical protein UU00_C0016G0002 [Microgenomates group bacterium GW2011_GWC1_40_35]KKR64678.1 MAG: hypothetical protein UU05_C0045G0015 [Candidatus Curtissbacteria bacterium GW2011_GWA1_40_47]KKS01343.1 MAG: hypothetical protein UU53_C0014G0030 [Candidatus Curtissbacteria bacterium GW2011_GWC2_41_21]OGD78265.1 MAG: hypothetical protein A2683_01370 [Candidatus Curtissbacteria bacterium RIFCSPHIGHO2_01_FULL_3